MRAWLGVELAVDDGRWTCPGALEESLALEIRSGFIDLDLLGDASPEALTAAATILERAGAHTTSVRISGRPPAFPAIAEVVAAARLPMMETLWLGMWDEPSSPVLADALVDALVEATPRLFQVILDGPWVAHRFAHPDVADVVLDHTPIAELIAPSATALRLASGNVPSVLAVPSLARLSLAGREAFDLAVLEQIVDHLPVRDRVAQLTLPEIRYEADLAGIQLAIDRLPGLETIVVQRAHAMFGSLAPRLHHARAHVEAPPVWPWPPMDVLGPLGVETAAGRRLYFIDLLRVLERSYATLAPADRSAWDVVFGALDPRRPQITLPRDVLAAALDAIDLPSAWRPYRSELANAPPQIRVLRVR